MKTYSKDHAKTELFCSVFGHNYIVIKEINHSVDEYQCKCCKQQFTMNEDGDLVNLSPKYKEIHAILEYINKKRRYSARNTFSSLDLI